MSPALVETSGLTMAFGAVRACSELDVAIREGEILGIVGPNGSGKSTLLKMLAGHLRPTAGRVRLAGTDITRWRPDRRARAGLVMTSQNQMVFGGVTVAQALEIARACRPRRGARTSALSGDGLVELLDLGVVLDETVGDLPLGYLRRVGVALAVTAGPRVLLLDEPAAGLNDDETAALRHLILLLRESGISIGIVDHDMSLMTTLCDRVVVLDLGTVLAEGEPRAVLSDPAVVDAYLGSPMTFATEEAV